MGRSVVRILDSDSAASESGLNYIPRFLDVSVGVVSVNRLCHVITETITERISEEEGTDYTSD